MSSPITPLEGWVLVKPIPPEEETTKSGIVLTAPLSPGEMEKRKNRGEVLAVPKKSPVSVGCTVFYKSYAGQDAHVNGETDGYLLIEIQDLCGVLKK